MENFFLTLLLLAVLGYTLWTACYGLLQFLAAALFLYGSLTELEKDSPTPGSIYPRGHLAKLLIVNKALYRLS